MKPMMRISTSSTGRSCSTLYRVVPNETRYQQLVIQRVQPCSTLYRVVPNETLSRIATCLEDGKLAVPSIGSYLMKPSKPYSDGYKKHSLQYPLSGRT